MLANKALSAAPSAVPAYIEDVFSAYLYRGTGANQTITNGIDLSTKGGLVWTKARSDVGGNRLFDTVRGTTKVLYSNATDASTTEGNTLTAFNTDGFSLGDSGNVNDSTYRYVSWTFAKQAKFFDVVTYTGTGNVRTVSHNLGSVPGCIIIKRTDTSSGDGWVVYHRSNTANPETDYLLLNSTAATTDEASVWNDTAPTSTVFTVGNFADVNANNGTYVAYLFAHDAGGFGESGSDSVIKCGSYTGTGSAGLFVDLGWEPQWILIKAAGTVNSWSIYDNMRGVPTGGEDQILLTNTSGAEISTGSDNDIDFNATGFTLQRFTGRLNDSGVTHIYIAIRKGPMKTPTTGTSIFTPTAFSGNDTSGTRSAGLNAFDLLIAKRTASSSLEWVWLDKLRGLAGNKWLSSVLATGEGAGDTINTINGQYTQDGINITKTTNYSYLDAGSSNYVWYALKRAPGFFDEVCYTGTGSARTVTHNLGVTPELMIVKVRSNVGSRAWRVYASSQGATKAAYLDANDAFFTSSTEWNDTAPTSSVFTVGTASATNGNGDNLVAYLFSSLTGVSKVGTYTGNGSSQTINCGFTAGARLILIKRTDSSGDWYIYDTARGIVSGNDSQLKLNTTAVAATGFDAVDPDNSGFIVNNDATNFPINVNAATYIYLAIA